MHSSIFDDKLTSMDFQGLSDAEMDVLHEALRAAADGPFFPDWEFHTLFGLKRETVRAIAESWPRPVGPADDVDLAVHNSLNNLLGYPHHQEAAWSQWISVDRSHLDDLFSRLRHGPGKSPLKRLK
jgi:hypothetical protein